jgi:Fe-S oxidoreductase
VHTVVTECAECYRTLSKDYDLEGVTVQHISQFLGARKLPLKTLGDEKPLVEVAYHDPCRLGRHMDVYDAPRELIRASSDVHLVELEEARDGAQCCGVAAMMNCDQASKALRKRRLDQVAAVDADVLVTTCPKCIAHLQCLKDEGGDYRFAIEDLTTFLAQRLVVEDDGDDEATEGGEGS